MTLYKRFAPKVFSGCWVVLLVAALFIERPFCKYLCPLGAVFAVFFLCHPAISGPAPAWKAIIYF